METLSRAQARRIALAAQGFLDKPHDPPTLRTLSRTVGRTGVLQIDSVNVLQRAHYLPLYSRMGPYDVDLLHRAAERSPRRLVEYWAHVAAFMPVELWPFMRPRMEHMAVAGRGWFDDSGHRELATSLLEQIRSEGARTASELDLGLPRRKDQWGWNWSDSKQALEYLFGTGEVAVARRTPSFERVYDVPERVLPAAVLAAPSPTRHEAAVELVRRAARSHGVATQRCLGDYYRMRGDAVQAAVAELVEAGELLPVTIEGWRRPAYLHRDARIPRRVDACTLLSPFDPVVWERERTQALFDFHYRIEIYVPAEKRLFGYYVLPFLLGDRLVARVDLKADRATGVLIVRGAYAEPGAPEETAVRLADELHRVAGWLGLRQVVVDERGDLAPPLSRAVRSS